MTLLAVQREFHTQLLSTGALPQAEATPQFRTGFEIYRNAYRTRLVACLRESYERVWSWIGDEAFDQAAIHHLILHPPHSWSLDHAGAGFDHTLAELYPAEPEVAELAWLEWQMQLAFRARNEAPIDPESFAVLTSAFEEREWGDMRLHLTASLAMRQITTACVEVWAAMDREEPWTGQLVLDRPATVMVWRQDLQPRFRIVQPVEACTLAAVLRHETFACICAVQGNDDAEATVGTMLGRWIVDGLVIGLG